MEFAHLHPESDLLKEVSVRLLRDDEKARFDQLLRDQHYLHSAQLAGQCLRYVAEFQGQWVALLTFSAAALHLKARDQWIGWTPRQRARRLPFIVNNSRFLLLPERERWPNLASRCGAKKVIRMGMSVDFQGFTQIQLVDGLTFPSLGLYARGLAESAAVGCDRESAGGNIGSLGAEWGKAKSIYGFSTPPTSGEGSGDRKTRTGRAGSVGEARNIEEMVSNACEGEVDIRFRESKGASTD